jgi:hypothetical protein
MANNRINRYIGAIALGTVMMAVPGCTDTWDDHYDSSESVAGTTRTLWDMIKDNPNYSKFANIVQHAKYYKDNTHPVSTYTYADILDGGQVNTVWVPDNTVLTDAEYAKWMEMLAESRTEGEGVNNAGFNVQQQFIGNHIALWRHNISEPGVDTVKMINGKNLVFDKTNRTFADIPLGEYNIPTANGVMHILKGIAPFRYNFYEYLKFKEPQTIFGKYVVSKDTTYFDSGSSIEGLPDENGNPTYVDSVYFTSNRLFGRSRYLPREGAEKCQMEEKCFGHDAYLNNEDSIYVMVMPTDAAWSAAYQRLSEAYNYATTYDDKSKGDLNTTATIKGLDPDSLKKMSLEMDLIAPLVFNIHKQPKRGEEMWTLEMFKTFKGDGGKPNSPDEYLLNTFGDTLRNVGQWDKTSLFDGEPVEMSNGLAYEVNSWNFPKEYYTPDVEVEIENVGIFYNTESTKYKVGVGSRRYSFSNEVYSDVTDIYGKVSNGNFYHLDAPGPTAAPKVEIKLRGNNPNAYVPNAQVMSGKYDIQLVVVPRWYIDIVTASEIEDRFFKKDTIVSEFDETDTTFVPTTEIDTNYVKNLASINKFKFRTQISYNNDAAKDKTSSWVTSTSDGLKVDTITIAEDFEFPYSYKNMRFTYPTLILEGYTGKNDAKNGFVYDLVLDKVILRRKN